MYTIVPLIIKGAVIAAAIVVGGVIVMVRRQNENASQKEALRRNEALIRSLTEKIRQLELERKESEDRISKLEGEITELVSENARLINENQSLTEQNSDLQDKRKRARNLEEAAPALLDWVQSVMGYSENKSLFPTDADELSKFRADVKKLPSILKINGIECCFTPPKKGIGFLHLRDHGISDDKGVISAPMLLRGGLLIAEGIILVPDVDVSQSQEPAPLRNDGQQTLETGHRHVRESREEAEEDGHTSQDAPPIVSGSCGIANGEPSLSSSERPPASSEDNASASPPSAAEPTIKWDFDL